MGRQYDKQHAHRGGRRRNRSPFVAFNGARHRRRRHLGDSMGVSRAPPPSAVRSVITGYTALVEASAPIAAHAFVKPAADGSGKAAVGSNADHCGKALEAATAAGQLIEVVLYRHLHA